MFCFLSCHNLPTQLIYRTDCVIQGWLFQIFFLLLWLLLFPFVLSNHLFVLLVIMWNLLLFLLLSILFGIFCYIFMLINIRWLTRVECGPIIVIPVYLFSLFVVLEDWGVLFFNGYLTLWVFGGRNRWICLTEIIVLGYFLAWECTFFIKQIIFPYIIQILLLLYFFLFLLFVIIDLLRNEHREFFLFLLFPILLILGLLIRAQLWELLFFYIIIGVIIVSFIDPDVAVVSYVNIYILPW